MYDRRLRAICQSTGRVRSRQVRNEARCSARERKQSAGPTCLNPPPSLRPFPYTPLPDHTHSHSPFPPTRNANNSVSARPPTDASPSATHPPRRCASLLPLHPFTLRMPSPSSVSFSPILFPCLSSDPFPKVGIATQLPSGTHLQDNLDYNSYWDFLLNQHDSYESLPAARLGGISYVQRVFPRL